MFRIITVLLYKQYRGKIMKILIALLLITNTIFALNNKELSTTIDLSGKQRMLTQEMAKEAFLIKLDIDKKTNIEKLAQNSQLFDKTLKALINGDKKLELRPIKNTKIQAQLKKVISIWNPYYKEIKDIINGKNSKKSYSVISSQNSMLLKEMDTVVKLYTSQNKKSNFVLINDVNLAGKQRMLLQKMAKSLVVANNGIDVEKYRNDFIDAKRLFTKTLKGLLEGDKELKLKGTKLSLIRKQLEVVNKLWNSEQKRLKDALVGKNTKSAILALDNISVEMDKSFKLYTESFNRQKQRNEFASLIKIYTSLEKMDNQTKLLLEKLAKVEVE